MTPPIDLVGQPSKVRGVDPPRRTKQWGGEVGCWAGMTAFPRYRGGKGSPERDRNQQGHRALDGGAWVLTRDLCFHSPAGLQAVRGTRGHCAPGRNEWLDGGDVPDPDKVFWAQETTSD